ncbi:dihydrodipicolinate synthase family protein, partial [Streptomyces sp. NPDC059538]|uniref:dihydrodipicolinate synthase family protein n=1 Tax=Streptomyces sp. NPDC059538 TaxID=3346860 RepID=UPI0036BC7015
MAQDIAGIAGITDIAGVAAAAAALPTRPLQGIHVPLVTPFTRTGEVAAEALEALAHEVLDAGATGIVALGTTAEAACLEEAERDLVTTV